MKSKIFTLLVFIFIITSAGYSQDYNSAVGLRFGSPTSVSYKKFISGNSAFEVTAGYRGYSGYSWFNVGAYYQLHNDISSVRGLKWYYGAGANVYFWSFDNNFINNDASSTSIGLSGVLGLDYKFADIPLNLSIDWIPTFFLNGFNDGFEGGYGALSARYVLD